nr:hypothetical protein [Mycobacterium uberis]
MCRALADLVEQGYFERRQGVGSLCARTWSSGCIRHLKGRTIVSRRAALGRVRNRVRRCRTRGAAHSRHYCRGVTKASRSSTSVL